MKKISIVLILTIAIVSTFIYTIEYTYSKDSSLKLEPKKIIQFKLNNPYNNTLSICELRVPENYSKDRLIPLFVWFGPGKGNYKIKNVPPFVDFKEFFVLALPYLDKQLPRIAIKEGYINEFWNYTHPMLQYVINQIPNLDTSKQIAGGYSSGAHFIASGLDRKWEGFTDFFTGYILHEGGYAPEMTYEGIYPSDKVLLTYGEKYDSPVKIVAEIMLQNHDNVTVHALANTGHEITQETIDYINKWVKEEIY